LEMKLSIVIPAFNVECYLGLCLDSVISSVAHCGLRTTPKVIVVDDGSTDGTFEIARNFANKQARITVIRHEENRGVSTARNTGIDQASGDWILMLDADNLLAPDALITIPESIKNAPDVDVLVLAMDLVDEEGRTLGKFYGDRIQSDPGQQLRENPYRLLSDNFIDNFSVIRRKIALDQRYDETLSQLEDWDFWIRAMFSYGAKFIFIPTVCGSYRLRSQSLTRSFSVANVEYLDTLIQIYCKVLKLFPHTNLPESLLSQTLINLRQVSLEFIKYSGYRTWEVSDAFSQLIGVQP